MKRALILLTFTLESVLPLPVQALTAQEIVLLKQNGVSEKTIQMMLESETAGRQPTADGQPPGVRTIIRPDGQPTIVYSTGDGRHSTRTAEERLKEQRAWEMLRHIIVDTRTAPGSPSGAAAEESASP